MQVRQQMIATVLTALVRPQAPDPVDPADYPCYYRAVPPQLRTQKMICRKARGALIDLIYGMERPPALYIAAPFPKLVRGVGVCRERFSASALPRDGIIGGMSM
jgi:hypothetical protein